MTEPIPVLYEDDQLLVCQKPIGLLSQEMAEDSLPELLKAQGRPYIGVIHRLDRNVGGTMVFAKTKQAAANLSAQVADHTMIKEYLAVVEGEPPQEGEWTDLLFKDSSKNKVFVVNRPRKGAKEAKLAYRRLQTIFTEPKACSLMHIRLYTGRTHQIRVQFASRKYPLCGDGKYGSKNNRCDVTLWCHQLTFRHPKSGEILSFSTTPPMQYPWDLFAWNTEAK